MLTRFDERQVIRQAHKEPGIHSSGLCMEKNLKVSPRTVRQLLHNNGFIWKKKQQVPALKDRHKQSRFEFTRMYQTWSSEWKSILFSDEKNSTWMVRMDSNITGPIKLCRHIHIPNGRVVVALLWSGEPSVTKVPCAFSQSLAD